MSHQIHTDQMEIRLFGPGITIYTWNTYYSIAYRSSHFRLHILKSGHLFELC